VVNVHTRGVFKDTPEEEKGVNSRKN